MKDKSLNILLAAAFGVPGLAILLLAWLRPEMGGERVVAIIVGGLGLLVSAVQVLSFFRAAVKENEGRAMIRVVADDAP